MVLFGKTQTVRRFGKITIVNGYREASHEDMQLVMDVQTQSKPTRMNETGKASGAKLKVFCDTELMTADKEQGIQADWLLYHGKWHECTECVRMENTILAHFEALFQELPEQPEEETSSDDTETDTDADSSDDEEDES
ncbi:MAG: hypothetical protein LUC83_01260 [Clostridiales bacterium]|nr:hypothetical protein [Clostridiales bacterium]